MSTKLKSVLVAGLALGVGIVLLFVWRRCRQAEAWPRTVRTEPEMYPDVVPQYLG